MRKTVGAIVMLLGVGAISRASADAWRAANAPLVESVRGCAQGDATACHRLAGSLAMRLKGISSDDQMLPERLGAAAADAIAHPDGAVTGVAESCLAGYPRACATLAQVLDRLFSGDDARLERSTDRLLAHDLAARIMAGASYRVERRTLHSTAKDSPTSSACHFSLSSSMR